MANRKLHVLPDNAGLLRAAAECLCDAIADVVSTKEYCTMALSGGSTPRGLYELLAAPAFSESIPWNKLRFFLGDERHVPHDHPDSNLRMVRESLFGNREPAPGTLFPVDTRLDPKEAAMKYEQTLREVIGKDGALDIVLLGLGDDAHTASLFPHTDALQEKNAWVKEVYVEKLNAWRISFTFPLINAARTVVFLVSGASKSSAVRQVLQGEREPDTFPAQSVQPHDGVVHWFLDEAAASALK
ncbi:MAG TPA: 6-phosphogluconolactonase [Cyclobacteriaceae bacterium]|nr:6-phosphogluconolactonase [Cyclobacteriaceae bacterium]